MLIFLNEFNLSLRRPGRGPGRRDTEPRNHNKARFPDQPMSVPYPRPFSIQAWVRQSSSVGPPTLSKPKYSIKIKMYSYTERSITHPR